MADRVATGSFARFNVADVICPDLLRITDRIGPDLEVSGEVDYLSDGGDPDRKFAVINVTGIDSPLIVPVDRLRLGPHSRVEPGSPMNRVKGRGSVAPG